MYKRNVSGNMVLSLVVGLILSFLYVVCFADETLTITTYYPSPYGSYSQLTADQIAIGSAYRNPTYADGTLYVSGNVGIGTTSPGAELEVVGQVKITGGSPGNNKVLTSDANGLASWQSAGGWYVPSSIIQSAVHTAGGNFGGYNGMYNWIQTNGCAGYHVCDETELVRYAQLHANTGTGGCQGWVAHGGVNVDPQQPSDCWNFTSTSGSGRVGLMNHPAGYHGTMAYDTCASAGWGVLCCK